MLLMVLSLLCAHAPVCCAADDGEETSVQDIETDDTVALEAPAGEAVIAEVVDSQGNNEQSEPETFENDEPSVTVTETFVTTDTSETAPEDKIEGMVPTETTYVLTESGETLRDEDHHKVDTSDAEVTVTASEPTTPEADPDTGATPDPEITITRTTVTGSENAIQKAVDKALEKITDDTRSITITVAAGTYNGDVAVTTTRALNAFFETNSDFILYLLGEGSYEEPAEGELIDKSAVNSAGGSDVVLNGNLTIDGINVTLAGIYLSLGNKVRVSGGSEVTIFGTGGDDGVDAVMEGSDNVLTVDTGAGDDTVTVTTAGVNNGMNTLSVDTGVGNDTAALAHGAGVLSADIRTGAGNDAVQLSASAGAARSYTDSWDTDHEGSLAVDLGGGDDILTVDAALAGGFAALPANAGEGYDTLILVGTLNEDESDPVSGTLTKTEDGTYTGKIRLMADGCDEEFLVTLAGGYGCLTDTLENKPTVELTKETITGAKAKSFTNYTYKYSGTDEDITADWSSATVVLTNLLVKGSEVNLGKLNIPTVNLTVTARSITVNGAVTAASIVLNTSDDDTLFDLQGDEDGVISSMVGEGTLSGSLMDFTADAGIQVKSGASLLALTGGLSMTAAVDQTHKLIDLLGDKLSSIDPNFFNVKVGDAIITVYGEVAARTAVTIAAKANVDMEVSNEKLASLFVPLAFVVSVTEASVEIVGGRITAGGDVSVTAESIVSGKAEATTGRLPVALAAAVAVNDAHVLLGGNGHIQADGNVTLSAMASTASSAKAGRGALSGNASGYIAVEVAVQDAFARVSDTASISAGGDVNIASSANLTGSAVATSATSGEGDDEGGEGGSTAGGGLGGVKDMLMQIGQSMLTSGKTKVFNKLQGVAEHVAGKAYRVNVTAAEHGSVSAPASANGHKAVTDTVFQEGVQYYKLVNGKYVHDLSVTPGEAIPKNIAYYVDTDPVRLVISPDKGYTVDKVQIKYLLKGASAYTTVTSTLANNALALRENSDGSYSFRMPDADVTVTVTFKEGTWDKDPKEDSTDAGLNDLFNEAVSGAEEDNDEDPGDSEADDAVQITVRYEDTYTALTGTPAGEFYSKGEDGKYTLVEGAAQEGVTYYARHSAYALTKDLLFQEDVEYFTRKADGPYEKATVTAGEDVAENTYYVRLGALIPSVNKADPKSTVTITVNPGHDKVVTGVTASYTSRYAPAQETEFKANTNYYLLVDGEYKQQTVKAGEKIPEGKTYYTRSIGNKVTETVTADSTGAYTFAVPTGLYAAPGCPGGEIVFSATFGDAAGVAEAGSQPVAGNAATAQSAGALAGGVNINNNDASITTSDTISAGGSVNVTANGNVSAEVKADGTAVGPDVEEEEAPPVSQTPGTGGTQITGKQTIVPYTVYIEPSKGAALKSISGTEAAKGIFILQVVSPTASFSRDEGKVIFTYTDAAGKPAEGTAALDTATGNYKVDLSGLSIQPGTQVNIKLKGADTGIQVDGEYLVSYTVTVDETRNGTVGHLSGGAGSGVYAFKVTPRETYSVQGAEGEGETAVAASPYVTYTKTTGETAKVALSTDGKGNYYFKIAELTGLKPGSAITVGAVFVESFRAITTETQSAGVADAQAGVITLDTADPARTRVGETVTFTLGAGSGHGGQLAKVSMSYTPAGAAEATVRELTLSDGKYSFVMPDADVTVVADFYNQIHTITVAGAASGDVSVNVNKAGVGETITLQLNETAVQAGKKITRIELQIGDNDGIAVTDNENGVWSYTIPARLVEFGAQIDLESAASTFTFTPVVAEKAVTVKAGTTVNGTIELSNARADAGETYTFTVTPSGGYKIRTGSVKVSLMSGGNTVNLTATGKGTEYTVALPADAASGAVMEIQASFEVGVQPGNGSGEGGKSLTSLGVSVAVGVTINNNKAVVKNADVEAEGLKVAASSATQGAVEAAAGYSAGDIGIGGAVAVQVGVAHTFARVEKTASLSLSGGDLTVDAASETKFDTKADAKGSEKSKNAGVGAGIAVSVTGVETVAEIADGTPIAIDEALSGVEVTASSSDNQTLSAVAGSAGGISITPVLALLVAGADTLAHFGKGTDVLRCDGDVTVAAESAADRQLAANAAAAGDSCGVGASFAVSVLHDKTVARLSRSTEAKNVKIATKARNRARSTARASASGAASSGGSDDGGSSDDGKSGADKQSDGVMGGAGKLSGHVNAGGVDPKSIKSDTDNKPSASTSEGGIEVAAALALNIQSITTLAQIDDGISVTAAGENGEDGQLTVESLALNEGEIMANGSASQGKIGVGVAVAIQVVNYKNQAIVGDAAITADTLTVRAGLITEEETEGEENESPDSERGWLMELLESALTDLVMKIVEAAGIADLFGESGSATLASIITDAVEAASQALLDGTGLEELLQNNPYEQVKENLANFVLLFLGLPDKLEGTMESLLGENWNNAGVWPDLKKALLEYFKTQGWPTVQGAILDNLVTIVTPVLQSYLNPVNPGDEVPKSESIAAILKDAFLKPETGILIKVRDKIVDDLLAKVTEIAGEYDISVPPRENMNRAGFEQALTDTFQTLADKVSDTLTDGLCDLDKLQEFLSGKVGDKLMENLKQAAMKAGKALTNAALDEITGLLGVKVSVEDDFPAHRFTTEAVAGAGGKQAAVAGSVAVAVIKGTTEALIAGTDAASANYVIVTGDLAVRAEGSQVEKTTASAAEDSRGKASTNLNAGAASGVTGNTDGTLTMPSVITEISNAAIHVGVGGSASADEREVTLTPDEGRKVRSVTVKYVKPDGSTATLELPMFGGKTFTVPEIAETGTECTITLAGRAVRVKPGSKLEYSVFFVDENTISKDCIDVSWTGDGSMSIAVDPEGKETETVDDVTYTTTVYVVKALPKEGNEIQDRYLDFSYILSGGKPETWSAKLTNEQFSKGFRFGVKRGSDGSVSLVLASSKEPEIKAETIVNISVNFISALTLGVESQTTGENDSVTRTKVTPGADDRKGDGKGNYTNTYTFKDTDGKTVAGTIKLLELAGSDNGAVLHASYEDRITAIVTAADGYKLDKLYLAFTAKGSSERTQDIVTTDNSIIDPNGGTAYLFYMPDANAVVVASVVKDESSTSGTGAAQEPQKTQSGKSIGVGAGFAMTYSDLTVTAGVGENRTVTAGTADIRAVSIHNTQTAGVAGTDPLAGASASGEATETQKDISLDASVSITVVTDKITAAIAKGSSVSVTGSDTVALDATDPDTDFVSFNLSAEQKGKTVTKASSFAAGKSTAVGASVTVNITNSQVHAELSGSVSATGTASVRATTFNRDNSEALATAMGADLDRSLNKFAGGVEASEKNANKLLAGEYFGENNSQNDPNNQDGGKKKNPTQTNTRVNDTLNKNGDGQNRADPNANVSSNALRTQNAGAPSTGGAGNTANEGVGQANSNGGQNMPNSNSTASQNFQVAAAVGLNITGHKASVTVEGALQAAEILVEASNRGNFLTKGTGIAMSLAQNSNSIAAGVSVSVDRNESTVDIRGDITAIDEAGERGDLTVKATTTQNMDGEYKGLLAAQALAGAVSGTGKFSIAGSVSVVVDNAVTAVRIQSTEEAPVAIEGRRIVLHAYDKTKLAVRAGGVSVSKGSDVGMGLAVAVVYGNNKVDVAVGSGAVIRGESLEINAEKARVDFSDFENAVGLDRFITDTSDVPAADKDKVKKGMINLDRDKNDPDSSYKVDINITTEDAVGMVDALNVLSSTNYYLEAIAGSIVGSGGTDSKASVAGSVAVLVFRNNVNATLGDNVTVELSGCTYEIWQDAKGNVYYVLADRVYEELANGTLADTGLNSAIFGAEAEEETETVDGVEYNVYKAGGRTIYEYKHRLYEMKDGKLVKSDVTWAILNGGENTGKSVIRGMLLRAADDANVRILAGSLSVAPSKFGVGLTVAWLDNEDVVTSSVGDGASIEITSGGYDQRADANEDVMLVTAAASIADGAQSTLTAGGALNVVSANNNAKASVGEGSSVSAAGDVAIRSAVESEILLVSLSVAGGHSKVAVGGTIAVVVNKAKAATDVGSGSTVESTNGSVALSTDNHEKIINVLASASAAPGGEVSVAGTLGVLVSGTAADTTVGDGASLLAKKDVSVRTDTSSHLVEIAAALSIGGSTAAVGATVLVNVLDRTAGVELGSGVTVTAEEGNVLIHSTGKDTNVIVGLAAGASNGNAFSGTIPVLVSNTAISTAVGEQSAVTAGDSIGVVSAMDNAVYMFAGGISVATGTVGLGATIGTAVLNNTVTPAAAGPD